MQFVKNLLFLALWTGSCFALSSPNMQVRSRWIPSRVNEPSCAMLQARLKQVGMTDQQIHDEQVQIQAIARSSRDVDVTEIFLRDHLPLDLNVNVVLAVDINSASTLQTAAGWQIKSDFVNWIESANPVQDLPSFLRLTFPDDHDVHLEVDMPLVQACFGQNNLVFEMHNGLVVQIVPPSVESL